MQKLKKRKTVGGINNFLMPVNLLNKNFYKIKIIFFIILLFSTNNKLHGGGMVRDAETERFLYEISRPLFNVANLNYSSVDLYLFNDDAVNAFVACGQKIFINTGLIMEFNSPSMLRGVLAHETGHIAGGHLARSDIALKKAQTPMIIGLLLGIGAAVAGDSDAAQGFLLGSQQIAKGMVAKYSRGQEAAADQASFTYLENLGLSSKGMIDVLYGFADQEALSSRSQSIRVRSHPVSRQRIRFLEEKALNSPFFKKEESEDILHRYKMIRAKLKGFLKKPDQIIKLFKDKNKEDNLYALSIALYRKALIEEAIETIDILIMKYPKNPWFYELKGQIYYESGKIDLSIEPYEKALKYSHKEPLIYAALATALLAINRKDETQRALILLKKAIDLDPKNPQIYFQMAIAESRLGDIGKAELSTAERYFILGNLEKASFHADRSKKYLAPSSPLSLRADDIILDSENTKQWRRKCPI